MNWDWLLGFIEGEGSFSVAIRRDKTSRCGFQVMPVFQLSQGWGEENKILMIEIKDFLLSHGINATMYADNRGINDGIRNNQYMPRWKIHIYSLENSRRLFRLLNGLEWNTKKRNDFMVWGKTLEMMERGEHLSREGISKILRMRLDNIKHVGRHRINKKLLIEFGMLDEYRTKIDTSVHCGKEASEIGGNVE